MRLREGTVLPDQKINLVYNAGGIGDFIYWTQAIRFAVVSNPHIRGNILAPSWFVDLARLWLGDLKDRFRVKDYAAEWSSEECAKKIPAIVPDGKQYANATGFHLHLLGFVYYNQIDYVPVGWECPPVIRGDEADISRFGLPEEYVVITPYATHENRRLRASAINDLTTYLSERGVTPVFLGRSVMAHDHQAAPDDGINREHVVDLSEGTTLREAACVMANARAVIGLDNGLLHLASCSMVPVVFAFTTVVPRLRVPERRKGAKTLVLTPPESLKCRFCTAERYIIGHDFKDCLYKDNLCTTFFDGPALVRAYEEITK